MVPIKLLGIAAAAWVGYRLYKKEPIIPSFGAITSEYLNGMGAITSEALEGANVVRGMDQSLSYLHGGYAGGGILGLRG